MSLLPPGASFEEQVQEIFLAHRGSALMLSPLDAALVMGWAERGIPLEVVARGIRQAAEKAAYDAKAGESGLRSLRACRASVEKEIKKYVARNVGNAAPLTPSEPGGEPDVASLHPGAEEARSSLLSLEEERHKKLCAALRKLAKSDDRWLPVVARLLAGPLREAPVDLLACEWREELVLSAFLRALPFTERLAIGKEAKLESGGSLSREGQRMALRFQRGLSLKRRIELPSFW